MKPMVTADLSEMVRKVMGEARAPLMDMLSKG
jgi:hypothetical protein